MAGSPFSPQIAVVVATRNRRDSLLRTLERLSALPGRPPVIVVDNASTDGTAAAVVEAYPDVRVLRQERNLGAVARNAGVQAAGTPYVAFSDDDSWWQPEALERAVRLLDAHPRVAVLAARIRVGERGEVDPTCLAMEASPFGRADGLPAPRVLGFVACGAVVRCSAFLAMGGFHRHMAFVGEERLLACDLATAGWACAYVADVVAEHRPSSRRDPRVRRRLAVRDDLVFSWLRLPLGAALQRSAAAASAAVRDPDSRVGLAWAARDLPRIVGERRVLPRSLARAAERLA